MESVDSWGNRRRGSTYEQSKTGAKALRSRKERNHKHCYSKTAVTPWLSERRKRDERTRRAVPHSRWRDFIFPTHRPNKFTHTERETERGKSQERKIFVCIATRELAHLLEMVPERLPEEKCGDRGSWSSPCRPASTALAELRTFEPGLQWHRCQ